MDYFFELSKKQLLKDRNDIFKEVGIPSLLKNGFEMSVFNNDSNGEFDPAHQEFNYNFCRLTENTYLEMLYVTINKNENNICFYICAFKLVPKIDSLISMKGTDGMPFYMTINNKNKYMQLRCDDYKGSPLYHMLFSPSYDIKCYFTKSGYEYKRQRLKHLVKSDMTNIDRFVKRWYELHKPIIKDPDGNNISI
ncbi:MULTISPECIES: hypothetical protein [Sphingobacterium]|uniref:Uncharacterized protein n=1 Tax=Sphingobacterium siyangense TaxID=459529 RepID=A0A420FB70_9SPHI|nr:MULTISPECIES: hypothetical protein [Sphingobacterium]MBB1644826.1 hypothetical protein [Sphingobacterium sp. UME9]RKF30169.1 hypothetical protein BCY89_20430 [Sphingobacterium siyangense]